MQKPYAVFLSHEPENKNFSTVYSPAVRERISSMAELDPAI